MKWDKIYPLLLLSRDKYPFYEGTFSYVDIELSKIANKIPRCRVGWGRRAVDVRANKTQFDRFENDTMGLNDIFSRYKGEAAFNKIKDDVLICGVGFLAVSNKTIMPFNALEATGRFNWYEQNLEEGVAVFKRTENKSAVADNLPPDSFIHFTRYNTVIKENGLEINRPNPTGRPLIGMLTHRSSTKHPFGRSVLTAPARDAIIDASRTRRQAMIASIHYNKKVDVILGADSDTDVDTVQSQTGDIIKIGTNQNGQIPQVGEFAQHALAPFSDSIMMAARDFCTETKLSLNNLSLGSNAPQSPEALSIIGDDLRDDISDWQEELGEQIKYLTVTIWMLENNVSNIDNNLQKIIDAIKVAWKPIFRADVSKFGDGLTKIAEKAPAIVKQKSIWRNLGLTSSEIDEVVSQEEVI